MCLHLNEHQLNIDCYILKILYIEAHGNCKPKSLNRYTVSKEKKSQT